MERTEAARLVDVHGEAPGSGPLSGSEGDHTYQAGARYLFLPLNSSPPFEDFDECNSATQEYSGAIAADAPPNAVPPEPATPADLVANVAGQYPWQALPAVAIVLVLGGLLLVWRRRRQRL